MGVAILIRRNATGEVREVNEPGDWLDPETATEFLWTEGNYGCDCNRSLFFSRAGGEPDDECRQCGEDDFSIRVRSGDSVVYDEWDAPLSTLRPDGE